MKAAYLEITERSLEAAEAALAASIQEKAAFLSYHAFESLGGAWVTSRGNNYPRGHAAKLLSFANSVPQRHRHSVGRLVIALSSLRNLMLYPDLSTGSVVRPQAQISISAARDQIKRVRGLLNKMRKSIQ